MKVKCINDGYNSLTLGKTYEVIDITKYGLYKIINNNHKEEWFYKDFFKPVSEVRNEIINKLLEWK